MFKEWLVAEINKVDHGHNLVTELAELLDNMPEWQAERLLRLVDCAEQHGRFMEAARHPMTDEQLSEAQKLLDTLR